MPSHRTPAGVVLSLVIVAGLAGLVRWRAAAATPDHVGAPAPAGACSQGDRSCGAAPWSPPTFPGDSLCPTAGYLCPGYRERGIWRVVRWNGDTDLIRIRVPRPPETDLSRAMALQQAAARGIRAWHGHPFPLRVELTDREGPADFVVRWVARPTDSELGHARTEWSRRGDRAELRVVEFTLSHRSPFDPSRTMDPRQVELSAAHEMGHALGLPHSDDPGDVLYPTNTATRLSVRDYRTMEALYALPNGAEIVP